MEPCYDVTKKFSNVIITRTTYEFCETNTYSEYTNTFVDLQLNLDRSNNRKSNLGILIFYYFDI